MREQRPQSAPIDCLQVKALGLRSVITVCKGKMTTALAEEAFPAFQRIVEPMTDPVWVIDALGVTSFEPKILAQGPRWMSLYRQRGGKYFLLASRWERSIMASHTIALGFGVRVEAFSTLELTLQRASELTADTKS